MSDKETPRNYKVYVSFIIFMIFYMYMGIFGVPQIADHMAKNPDNIIKGCMYYVRDMRRRYSNVIEVMIDGKAYDSTFIYTKKSELYAPKNHSEFENYMRENPNLCHQVGYITLVNLGFYKKIYVYHYYGDFKLN